MNHDDSQLTLHDYPVLAWVFGLVFASIGAIIFQAGGSAPALVLVFVAIGLGALLFASVLTITADRITRTLKLEYRSAMLHSVKQLSFDEIAGINVERRISRNKGRTSYTYRVVAARKEGQPVPFRSYSSSGWRGKERLASQLRDFIDIQAPQPPVPEIRETDGVHWQVQSTPVCGATRSRWHLPDFKIPGVFLFVAQKAEGQASHGFLASLGAMFFRQCLMMYGFQGDDTPGLDRAAALAPLDPSLEPHFMAFSNDPGSAGQILHASAVVPLANWAARYPVRQFRRASPFGQLVVLFGPNGIDLVTMYPLQPGQMEELAALGTELVKSQGSGSLCPTPTS